MDEQEIIDALETAATSPASAAVDGQSATARSAEDQIKLFDYLDGRRLAAERGNNNGWGMVGRARIIPPGGT